MKLVIDMNMSPRWVELLSAAGFEAVHWSQLGAAFDADTEIMAFARTHGFVVFTNDLDFGFLLAATRALGPSVVQVRMEALRPERIGLRVLEALTSVTEELEQGALVTVDSKRVRVKVLPLR
jgi:predicted nuclease of predicted toxin-antitoxin system